MAQSIKCSPEYNPAEEMMEVGAVQAAPASSSPPQFLRVFPVKNKRPLVKGWQDAATTDPDVIGGWKEKYPNCNWGATLDPDTLVIDCDCAEAVSALHDRGEANGGIPATLTTVTGRGFHFWFRTSTAVLNRVAVMPGVDVRTAGGFVVVPPSVHESGTRYEFAWEECPIADAPTWLLQLVRGTSGTHSHTNSLSDLPVIEGAERNSAQVQGPTPFQKDLARRDVQKGDCSGQGS